MKEIKPYIDTYFRNGIDVNEMSACDTAKQHLRNVLRAWRYLKANPWATNDDMRQFFHYAGVATKYISDYIQSLEYIKNTYSATTRAEAQMMADYAARTALKQAAEAGDRQDLIKAGNLLTKIHQLDKPEADKERARLTALPVVFTPYVEDIDAERKTIDDTRLLSIMHRFGVDLDSMEEKIREKRESMSPPAPKGGGHPDSVR